MPDPPAVSNVGAPKCPTCLIVPTNPLPAVATLSLFLCPECNKTFIIQQTATEYTTFPTAIDPSDLLGPT